MAFLTRPFQRSAASALLGLACVCGGVVAIAEEQSFPVITGLEDTTLSGTVDTSASLQVPTSYQSAIPEPETYGLVAGLGLCALAIWRRRSR